LGLSVVVPLVCELGPVMGNQAIIIAAVKNEAPKAKTFFILNMQNMQNML
jgi:hypothetical protein